MGALFGLAVALGLAAVALWPTVLELAESWQNNAAYLYAWLLVPMFVYLVAVHWREEILADQPRADVAGLLVAFVAAIGWIVAAAANIAIGCQLSLILAIQGVVLTALGRTLYARWLPLMGLLFLMLPSGDLLLSPLRQLTVEAIEAFARYRQLPYRIDGFSLRIGEHSYVVLDACAGLAHVTLTFFLGYCAGVLLYRAWYKVAALALFAALLGVLSNVIRVNAIVWLDWVNGSQMDLAAHGRVQWVALIFVLAILFAVLLALEAESLPSRPALAPPPAHPGGRWLILACGLMLLLVVGGGARLLADEPGSKSADPVIEAPAAIVGWQLAAPVSDWLVERDFRTVTLNYRRGDQTLRLTVVETRSPAVKLDASRLAPEDSGTWYALGQEVLTVCAGASCRRLLHAIWRHDTAPAVRHVYYGYRLGDFQTHSNLALRLAGAAWRLTGRAYAARLIAVAVDGEALPEDELALIYQACSGLAR